MNICIGGQVDLNVPRAKQKGYTSTNQYQVVAGAARGSKLSGLLDGAPYGWTIPNTKEVEVEQGRGFGVRLMEKSIPLRHELGFSSVAGLETCSQKLIRCGVRWHDGCSEPECGQTFLKGAQGCLCRRKPKHGYRPAQSTTHSGTTRKSLPHH